MRKGLSSEAAVITLLVFGIVLIILAILYKTIFDVGEKEFSKKECQTSLLLTKAAEGYIKWWCVKIAENPIPLKCGRRFVTVTPKGPEVDGNQVKFEYNHACPDNFVRKGDNCLPENVLAKEMASCWNTFFEGEHAVFQQMEPGLESFYENHDRTCFVCSELTLSAGRDIENFRDYLKGKNYIFGGSYYDYLSNERALCNSEIKNLAPGRTCWDGMSKEIKPDFFARFFSKKTWPAIDQDNFSDGKTYAVTFIRYGMDVACGDEPEIPTMTVQALPAENIKEHCDVVLA